MTCTPPEARHHIVGKAGGALYEPQVKQAAVIELCTRQSSAQAVAKKLAVSRPTLYKWKNQLLGREVPTSMKFKSDSPPDPQRLALEQQIETLRRDVWQLQLEHDLLEKANELLKKGLGVNLPLLSNREKTLLVDALRETYALVDLFAELGLARSSYFHAYPVSSQAGLTLSNECETSAWRKQASPRNPPSKWLVAAQTSKTARALAFWEATG